MVRQQADAGIDIVSDGEFSKGRNWAFYVHDRLSGVTTRSLTEDEAKDPMASVGGGQDRVAFPEFYAEYDRVSGLGKRLGARFVVNAPLTYSDVQVKRDIANLKAAAAKAKVAGAFLPVVAPASALPNAKNEHYPDEKGLLWALADCLHQEYKSIVDAGLYVQVDDAFLPYMHEKMVPPMTHAQYRAWAQMRIDALNHALRGIPPETHALSHLLGQLERPACLRRADEGHRRSHAAGERGRLSVRGRQSAPRARMGGLAIGQAPPGKVLIPGVISDATNIVEHPELVAQRIVRLAEIVGKENVMGGTDCGFAQSPFAQRVHPSIMWAKLKSLAEGARIATRELWGRRSAS